MNYTTGYLVLRCDGNSLFLYFCTLPFYIVKQDSCFSVEKFHEWKTMYLMILFSSAMIISMRFLILLLLYLRRSIELRLIYIVCICTVYLYITVQYETELNFNASFQKTGETGETKSVKRMKDVILWIYSEDGDHKIAEKKIDTYEQFRILLYDKFERTNINEKRQYRIYLMNLKIINEKELFCRSYCDNKMERNYQWKMNSF